MIGHFQIIYLKTRHRYIHGSMINTTHLLGGYLVVT